MQEYIIYDSSTGKIRETGTNRKKGIIPRTHERVLYGQKAESTIYFVDPETEQICIKENKKNIYGQGE